jgi:hypothetical protein
MMKSAPKPSCPKCGGANTKCLGVEPIYPSQHDLDRRQPIARILTFQCSCGFRFTETVIEPPLQEAIVRAIGHDASHPT